MNRFLEHPRVLLVLRLIVGAAFVYAGSLKIQAPQAFADSIATFQLLPVQLINLLALGLPPFEVIAGLLLISGRQPRMAAFSILLLTVVFALALSQAIVRGLKIDCGCFGSGAPSEWKAWQSLGRDLLLMVAVAPVYCKACRDEAEAAAVTGLEEKEQLVAAE